MTGRVTLLRLQEAERLVLRLSLDKTSLQEQFLELTQVASAGVHTCTCVYCLGFQHSLSFRVLALQHSPSCTCWGLEFQLSLSCRVLEFLGMRLVVVQLIMMFCTAAVSE